MNPTRGEQVQAIKKLTHKLKVLKLELLVDDIVDDCLYAVIHGDNNDPFVIAAIRKQHRRVKHYSRKLKKLKAIRL